MSRQNKALPSPQEDRQHIFQPDFVQHPGPSVACQRVYLRESWRRHAVGALLSAVHRGAALRGHTGVHVVIGRGDRHVFSLQEVSRAAALPVEAGKIKRKT